MGAVLQFQTSLESEVCCSCGVQFAFPSDLVRKRRGDKQSFYCPNGHSQHYTGESDHNKIARLARELAEAEARIGREQERVTRERVKATRLRKRIAAGVCPCCHRTVSQLARHMETKHPTYKDAEIA